MTVLLALECVLIYSVGDALTVVPALDGGKGLSSGLIVEVRLGARDGALFPDVDFDGTTVRSDGAADGARLPCLDDV